MFCIFTVGCTVTDEIDESTCGGLPMQVLVSLSHPSCRRFQKVASRLNTSGCLGHRSFVVSHDLLVLLKVLSNMRIDARLRGLELLYGLQHRPSSLLEPEGERRRKASPRSQGL